MRQIWLLLLIIKAAGMCRYPLGMDAGLCSLLLFLGRGKSHIVISYFDYAEERVLSERPAFTIPPA